MIMESKTAHKVPAISTSEDSQEVPPSSSDYCSPAVDSSNSEIHSAAADTDESREMGETRRVKPPMDRDEMAPSSDNQDTSVAVTAVSSRMDVDIDNRKENHNGNGGMTEAEKKNQDAKEATDAEAPMSVESVTRGDEVQKMDSSTNPSSVTKETHHSLLPSPSASFDPVMDGQSWSHAFNARDGGVEGSTEKQAPKPRHRRSPATTFPLPSPKSSPRPAEYGDDEASFNLFNQSFDTMSDTATYLRDLQHTESAANRGYGLSPSFSMLGLRQHRRDASHNMDISLPALGQYAGDVSPIRVYGEGGRHGRSMSGMEPIPVHFPQDEEAAAHGYQGDAGYSDQAGAAATNPYGGNIVSNPFFVLRCARKAFSKCTFLLSCLSTSDPCAVNVSENGSFQHYQGSDNQAYHESLSSRDLNIASRRVGAAICAFGGSTKPEQTSRKNASIFRRKGDTSGETTRGTLVSHQAYEERLRSRYFQNGNHISWEVEENPPVETSDSNQARNNILVHMNTSSGSYVPRDGKVNPEASPRTSSNKQISSYPLSPYSSIVEMTSNGTEPPKMKYRCKLCGQPKQNHNCPYRQSMQRSIGISVHPAVNSFTALEPGALTSALSEMNNFVSYDSDHGSSDPLRTASIPPATGKHRRTHASVTPETFRPAGVLLSPQSSLSTRTSSPETTPPNRLHQWSSRKAEERSDATGHDTRKRSHSEMETEAEVNHDASVPFIEEVPLRPEQYRAVTRSKNPEPVGAYQYPTIPLTYVERQRLSDTLFVLTREIPNLTEECSSILSGARMEGKWDLAIAELLTQLVVGLYCQEGDRCLDGLQHYLLYLGISC